MHLLGAYFVGSLLPLAVLLFVVLWALTLAAGSTSESTSAVWMMDEFERASAVREQVEALLSARLQREGVSTALVHASSVLAGTTLQLQRTGSLRKGGGRHRDQFAGVGATVCGCRRRPCTVSRVSDGSATLTTKPFSAAGAAAGRRPLCRSSTPRPKQVSNSRMLFMPGPAFHARAAGAMRVCHHARRLAAPGIRGYAGPAMPPATDTPASPPLAAHDEQLLRDARQFQAHCASDHGADALLLPGWSVDDWAALLAGARVHTLARGQVLMRAGQSQRSLYLLASGGLELRSGAGGSFGFY